jgi:hypothetical protein
MSLKLFGYVGKQSESALTLWHPATGRCRSLVSGATLSGLGWAVVFGGLQWGPHLFYRAGCRR